MSVPPFGIKTLDTYGIPLTNTLVLLGSGSSVTWAHHALVKHSLRKRDML